MSKNKDNIVKITKDYFVEEGYYKCPECDGLIRVGDIFCSGCGKRIMWDIEHYMINKKGRNKLIITRKVLFTPPAGTEFRICIRDTHGNIDHWLQLIKSKPNDPNNSEFILSQYTAELLTEYFEKLTPEEVQKCFGSIEFPEYSDYDSLDIFIVEYDELKIIKFTEKIEEYMTAGLKACSIRNKKKQIGEWISEEHIICEWDY